MTRLLGWLLSGASLLLYVVWFFRLDYREQTMMIFVTILLLTGGAVFAFIIPPKRKP
jgi:hypothetical protein